MKNVAILTDTSLGISRREAESLGYNMIALPFILDEKEYDDDTLSKDDFYEKLKEAKDIHTSQASSENIRKTLDLLLEKHDKVLYFPITSGLSGSYLSALAIASENKYKDKVIVVDHKTISVLQLIMLDDVSKMIKGGVDLLEIKKIIEDNAKNNRIYISVDTLEYLKKGGRISGIATTVGNLLSIKPILFSNGGKFEVIKKVRGLKAAEDAMIELIDKDIKETFGGDRTSLSILGAYTKCIEEADKYRDRIEKFFNTKIIYNELPSVIGCHIGSGAVAVAIYKRVNVL